MNMSDFYDLAIRACRSLPEKERAFFMQAIEALEECGPEEWGQNLSDLAGHYLGQGIGDTALLEAVRVHGQNTQPKKVNGTMVLGGLIVAGIIAWFATRT